jgi:SAM-dependent methyltransferase
VQEVAKTNAVRPADFATRYLGGRVIDIGCGDYLVCPGAEPFDLAQGDANHITRFRPAASYDAVHSSHCLEHMVDPVAALAGWWDLVKPGGHLIVVVPEETLYEQGQWPSHFNPDHKVTFRLGGAASAWSPVSFDLLALCEALPDAEILSADLQDAHYDRALLFPAGRKARRKGPLIKLLISAAKRVSRAHKTRFENRLIAWGYPVDQTRRDALAQIQVVVRKREGA